MNCRLHNINTQGNKKTTLDMLCPGESAVVRRIEETPLKRRLQELGLDSGVNIKCLYKSPLGDPIAYEFSSGTVAIRSDDGKSVIIWD